MGDVIAFPRSAQQRKVISPQSPQARRATERQRPEPSDAVGHRSLLWREAVGHELREERLDQGRTQGDVAERAGISTQYLSEVERGRKEPSSEILEAVTGALRLPLADLVLRAAGLLEPAITTTSLTETTAPARPDGPVLLAA